MWQFSYGEYAVLWRVGDGDDFDNETSSDECQDEVEQEESRFLNFSFRRGTVCHKIESPQFCHPAGSSVLGTPDPRRTETFSCQTSTSH